MIILIAYQIYACYELPKFYSASKRISNPKVSAQNDNNVSQYRSV